MKESSKAVRFQYDTLVDRINICNREHDIKSVKSLINRKRPTILYAPRRFGKTSLVKNIIIEDFKKEHKDNAVIFANFMGVGNLLSISLRLQEAVTKLIYEITPLKSRLGDIVGYFKNLTVVLTPDPITGAPSLEIKGHLEKPQLTISELFSVVKKLSKKRTLLIVFDEFQDISLVKEAEALLRTELQEFINTPVIILGSKRILLEKMFSSNKSSFFNYGEELNLENISAKDWLPYFNERLKKARSSIELGSVSLLLDLMCDVPNSVCEVGAWLTEYCGDQVITKEVLTKSLDTLIENKEQSFRFQLSLLSRSEKSVFHEIAKNKFVEHPTSKSFLQAIKPSGSAAQKIIYRLVENGILEWEFEKGYRISDPLLRYFVLRKPI